MALEQVNLLLYRLNQLVSSVENIIYIKLMLCRRYLISTFSSIFLFPASLVFPELTSAQMRLPEYYLAQNPASVSKTSLGELFAQSSNPEENQSPNPEENQSSNPEENASSNSEENQSPNPEENQSPNPEENASSNSEENQSSSPEDKALQEMTAEFKALPGEVSFLVKEGESTLAELNSTNSLAVASAFKLAVLKTLKSEIDLNKRSWNNVITIRPEWKSLPSGILHGWEDGSPLTLKSLATLMISVSDNTATDTLINLLGKEVIELISPRNRPFLTTRELFVLKSSQNSQLLEQYRQGTEAERQLLLPKIAKLPLPDIKEFEGKNPVAIDVEWFFSAEELCGIMTELGNLPLMTINPGLANPEDWQKVAFKGGSEPGVLNLTSWLQGKNGKNYCVVATWNNKDEPLEQSKFSKLYREVLASLADRK